MAYYEQYPRSMKIEIRRRTFLQGVLAAIAASTAVRALPSLAADRVLEATCVIVQQEDGQWRCEGWVA